MFPFNKWENSSRFSSLLAVGKPGGPSGTLGVTRGARGQLLPWQGPGSTANFATGGVFMFFIVSLDKGHQKYIVCGLLGLSLCKNRAHVGPNLSFTTCLHAFHHRSPMLHGPLPGLPGWPQECALSANHSKHRRNEWNEWCDWWPIATGETGLMCKPQQPHASQQRIHKGKLCMSWVQFNKRTMHLFGTAICTYSNSKIFKWSPNIYCSKLYIQILQ
jgi:hypothetical protein